MISKQLTQNQTMKYSGYDGLGKSKVCTYGIILVHIKFRKIEKRIKMYVISDDFMTSPILLGRKFLRAFGIFLSIAETNSNQNPRPKIEINLNKENNQIRIGDRTLHCVYNSLSSGNSYLISERGLGRCLPNACIANCDSVGIVRSVKLLNSEIIENSKNSINRSMISWPLTLPLSLLTHLKLTQN